ncbi:MAG: hypothetical protein HKN68_08630 [Saprospiraceae bacterium]|nr:hypothetical protein [Saprospiraceae bacterium]
MKLKIPGKILIFFITAISFFSCGSDRQELFIVDNEIEFILPGALNTIETHVFIIRNVPSFYKTSLTANGASEEQVVSITATRARLMGSFGPVDYDFIAEISVRAISKTDPGLNREMYFQDRIPFNHSGDLELFSSISELREILSDEIFDMEVRIRLRQSTPLQIQNKLIFSYAVFDE